MLEACRWDETCFEKGCLEGACPDSANKLFRGNRNLRMLSICCPLGTGNPLGSFTPLPERSARQQTRPNASTTFGFDGAAIAADLIEPTKTEGISASDHKFDTRPTKTFEHSLSSIPEQPETFEYSSLLSRGKQNLRILNIVCVRAHQNLRIFNMVCMGPGENFRIFITFWSGAI